MIKHIIAKFLFLSIGCYYTISFGQDCKTDPVTFQVMPFKSSSHKLEKKAMDNFSQSIASSIRRMLFDKAKEAIGNCIVISDEQFLMNSVEEQAILDKMYKEIFDVPDTIISIPSKADLLILGRVKYNLDQEYTLLEINIMYRQVSIGYGKGGFKVGPKELADPKKLEKIVKPIFKKAFNDKELNEIISKVKQDRNCPDFSEKCFNPIQQPIHNYLFLGSGALITVCTVFGIISHQNYSIYKNNRVETSIIYNDINPEDLRKKSQKQGNAAIITGLCGIASGITGYWLKERQKDRKRKITPTTSLAPNSISQSSFSPTFGIKIEF